MSRFLAKLSIILIVFAVIAAGCGPSEEPPEAESPGEAAETPSEAEPAEMPAEEGPSPKASKAIPVKIGVIIPLTGLVATYGEEAKKGIELAADEAAAEGLVAPDILIVDNEGKQQETITTANKFIDIDRVDVIIGAITSNNSLAAGDRAEAAGVPMVSPASTHIDVTMGKEYVFRVCFTDEVQGSAVADFAYDVLDARRAAVLVSSSEVYSMGLGEIFTDEFRRRGGQVVSTMAFTSDSDDFSGQITQLRLKTPDVVFLPAYYEAVAKCIRQARDAGLRSTFVGTDGWHSPDLYTLSGGAVAGNYFTTHFSPNEDRPVVKKFVQNYRAFYGEDPEAIAALSYDAARLVFDAVRRAGSAERQAVTDALAATVNFEGVSGRFSMDENHNPVKPILVIESGETSGEIVEVITP